MKVSFDIRTQEIYDVDDHFSEVVLSWLQLGEVTTGSRLYARFYNVFGIDLPWEMAEEGETYLKPHNGESTVEVWLEDENSITPLWSNKIEKEEPPEKLYQVYDGNGKKVLFSSSLPGKKVYRHLEDAENKIEMLEKDGEEVDNLDEFTNYLSGVGIKRVYPEEHYTSLNF